RFAAMAETISDSEIGNQSESGAGVAGSGGGASGSGKTTRNPRSGRRCRRSAVYSRVKALVFGRRYEPPAITHSFSPSGFAGLAAGSRIHSLTDPAIPMRPLMVV